MWFAVYAALVTKESKFAYEKLNVHKDKKKK